MKKLWNRIANIFSVIAVCVIAGCSYAGDGENNNPPPVLPPAPAPEAPVKYTITYDAAGHGEAPEAKTVEKGYKLIDEDLQVLTADGFDFGGWKFNEKIAAAGEEVVSDMTLVAVWTEWGKAAIPTFSTAAGEVDYGTKVSIFTTTEGASIYYTTDGSEPTAASTKYESEIEITAAVTIKAIAVKEGCNESEVAAASYTIKLYTITFDANGHGTTPDAMTGYKGQKITLPAALTETGFTFDKWTDCTTDYAAGSEYTVNESVTLKAKWVDWNTVASPSFSTAAGEVDKGTKVSISTTTEGASIYYTTDGSAPTTASTKYESEIEITTAVTIKAIAVKSGLKDSEVAAANYTIKLYTVTFDANGHGTAPDAMTGYKGQTIKLPKALTETGWLFTKWTDCTTDYDAEANYTVTGTITIKALWKDGTPPANVTDLTANCSASQTVKLTWTNPADTDFAKVVITYDTYTNVEVLKTAKPNNEATVKGLKVGTEYTFTVKAYDTAENKSSGVSVKCTPVVVYKAGTNGGLIGTSKQIQGAVIKETWMTYYQELEINGSAIDKTSEVVVVPAGTVATVTMPDDSSWSTYYSGTDSWTNSVYQGVFLKNRKVKLDPFVMGQYQVTQNLYNKVMGNNPSYYSSNPDSGETQKNRPVEQVTWYQACAFCNELTKKTMTESDCVYYSNEALTTPYTATDAGNKTTPYIAYNTETKKWTKKGYRLPTEAEWEFAARGGNPNAAEWSYAYAGVQTKKEASKFNLSPLYDDELESYAWYANNSRGDHYENRTHEVGLKKKNTLNLYDMCGNVEEWCYDRHNETASSNDSAYKAGSWTEVIYVQNPVGASASDSDRCKRGGCFHGDSRECAVSHRSSSEPRYSLYDTGFRVVRSISIE